MNTINNYTVLIEDINIFEKIFGTDIYTLKRKTVRIKPKVAVNDYIKIPQELKYTHKNIELFANITYIQGQMFLITISKKIKFNMIQDITEGNSLY